MKAPRIVLSLAAAMTLIAGPGCAAEPAASAPQPAAFKRTVLRTVDVPGSNYEVVIVLIEAPAHVRSGRHTHPGTVVGYVLEGEFTMLIEGRPPLTMKAGDSTEVPAGAVHDEGTEDEPAKVLAVFTLEKGKPQRMPAP